MKKSESQSHGKSLTRERSDRFVILRHDHPYLHWDFLIENRGSLDSWRLLRFPACGEFVGAEVLPAHRMMYLDYEGPVSESRGTVWRIVAGTWIEDSATTVSADLSGNESLRVARSGSLKLTHYRSSDLLTPEAPCPEISKAILFHGPDGRWFWHFC